jgi:tetratricopeptide (TPR) repeat protein
MSHLRITSPKQFDVSKAIRQAIKLHQQDRLGEAEQIYTDVLATEPDNFDALHMLGVIRLSEGKPLEAFDLISRALAIDGHSWRALYNYGRVLAALGRFEEAVVRFELSLAIESGQADVFFSCGNALQKVNRHEDAVARLTGHWQSLPTRSRRTTIGALRSTISSVSRRRWQATTGRWRSIPTMSRRTTTVAIR